MVMLEDDDEEDDGKSKSERLRDAVNVWAAYGVYRNCYLLTMIPGIVVILGYQWGPLAVHDKPISMPIVYLYGDAIFHIIRLIASLLILLLSSHRVKDFESTPNKWVRVWSDRAYTASHLVYAIGFGSYCVHAGQRGTSPYNCALYCVIVTSVVEVYFVVNPSLTKSVTKVWREAKTSSPYKQEFEGEFLTGPQITRYRDHLFGACEKLRNAEKSKCLWTRRLCFASLAVAELMVVWTKKEDICERGTYFLIWIIGDMLFNFLFCVVPLPSLPAPQTIGNKALFEKNPMRPYHILVGAYLAHCTWAGCGIIILSWYGNCVARTLFNTAIASVVLVGVLELRNVMQLWLLYDYVVTIYFLWAIESPEEAAALIHWAQNDPSPLIEFPGPISRVRAHSTHLGAPQATHQGGEVP
eukprot:c10946_g1_i1.p1 GENE.c10946_g1_i1~~c10946_g1_i1.p1  ORF type:complete len:455 (-),score=60.72 c10946_g1_i1:66-1301(-)